MIDPDFYAKWNEEGAPVSANAAAVDALPDEAFNKRVLADPAVVARVKFQNPITDEVRQQYLETWQSLKAAQ